MIEKWLERHPEVAGRRQDIRIVRGQWHTKEGIKTEVIQVSIVKGDDLAGYDPAKDQDLYEYYLADEQPEME